MLRVCSSGLRTRWPVSPSSRAVMPLVTSFMMLRMPITAGMPRLRARMATWLVSPPCSRTKPRTFSMSSWAVSDGVRSSAKMMLSGGALASEAKGRPFRARRRLFCRSSNSAARSRRYSSSRLRMVAATWSRYSLTAAVAVLRSSRISAWISLSSSSSARSSRWLSKMAASCSPCFSRTRL